MKSSIWVAFGIAALAQWAVPVWSIWQHERVIEKGEHVRLRCRAPDPYDPLRGRYLAVALEPSHVPTPLDQVIKRDMKIYLLLEPGADGVSQVTGVTATKPTSGVWMAAHAAGVYESIQIRWPFDRYYLNENLAPQADVWLAKMRTSNELVTAEIRVLNGRAVLVDLVHQGQSFREILKAMPKD
jgi:uncharacterized membrane-anchored protein